LPKTEWWSSPQALSPPGEGIREGLASVVG